MASTTANTPVLNAEADHLKRRWTSQLTKLGASQDAPDEPSLARRLTPSLNPFSDCCEVAELAKACMDGSAKLKKDGAICMAAMRYHTLCIERDEFCQDPTEH